MGAGSRLAVAIAIVLPISAQAGLLPPSPSGTRLLLPVSPACVSSPFGPRILRGHPEAGTFHYGVDLPAPIGTPIRATAPGIVMKLERRAPGGLQILVRHPGFIGVYSHLGRVAPAFAEGQRTVSAGEKLGVVGLTGVAFGPHLYFGMIVNGHPVNPAPFLGVTPCKGGGPHARSGQSLIPDSGKMLPLPLITAAAHAREGGKIVPARATPIPPSRPGATRLVPHEEGAAR
jgi:hypothetical protein